MLRFILTLLLLLGSSAAWAQTGKCPDGQFVNVVNSGIINQACSSPADSGFMTTTASNAQSPLALQNLTSNLLTVSGGILVGGSGTPQHYFGDWKPQYFEIALGSDANPITAPGPILRLSLTENQVAASCGSNPNDTACSSALVVTAIGQASSTMVTSAALFSADSSGPTSQAINAVGRVKGSGTGIGSGAYLEGRRDTTTAQAEGAEISVNNQTSTDCSLSYTTLAQCVGIWVGSRGAAHKNSVAVQVGAAGDGSSFREGITFNSGVVSDTTFGDHSSSTTSIFVTGTHTTALWTGGSAGNVGFGIGTSPAARLQIGGDMSAGAWGGSGIGLRQDAATYTDTSSSGTVSTNYVNRLNAPTIAASSATTYTSAATLSIGGPPTAGTNATITNAYALSVGAGKTLLSGGLAFNSGGLSIPNTGGGGILIIQPASTLTDTTGTGTVASNTVNSFGSATMAASSAVTYTNASTMVVSPPVAGTNVTATNLWAARFTGNVNLQSGIFVNGAAGVTKTCTVSQLLTLIFTNGILTGGTCVS